jgi:hypothetical protein
LFKQEKVGIWTMAVDFALARIKHWLWHQKLQQYLVGKINLDESELGSSQSCDLGKWIYTEGMSKYGKILEMQELEKVHNVMHTTVSKIVKLKKAGQEAIAYQELDKLANISKQITVLLESMENHTNSSQIE